MAAFAAAACAPGDPVRCVLLQTIFSSLQQPRQDFCAAYNLSARVVEKADGRRAALKTQRFAPQASRARPRTPAANGTGSSVRVPSGESEANSTRFPRFASDRLPLWVPPNPLANAERAVRIFSHVTLLPAAALLSSAFARSAAAERDAGASSELARAFGTLSTAASILPFSASAPPVHELSLMPAGTFEIL